MYRKPFIQTIPFTGSIFLDTCKGKLLLLKVKFVELPMDVRVSTLFVIGDVSLMDPSTWLLTFSFETISLNKNINLEILTLCFYFYTFFKKKLSWQWLGSKSGIFWFVVYFLITLLLSHRGYSLFN
jgi:hypothetical protein